MTANFDISSEALSLVLKVKHSTAEVSEQLVLYKVLLRCYWLMFKRLNLPGSSQLHNRRHVSMHSAVIHCDSLDVT